MLCLHSQGLKTLIVLLGVLHVVLAVPPSPRACCAPIIVPLPGGSSIVTTSSSITSSKPPSGVSYSPTTISTLSSTAIYANSNQNTTTSVTSGTPTMNVCTAEACCTNATYWAPTVSNWAEEGVDAKLSSWALNLVPNPPTAITNGTFPTQIPPPFTWFGNTSEYPEIQGMAGQLMAIGIHGMDTAGCSLTDAANLNCPPITPAGACGNMPRWTYLAWIAIYNMFSIHSQINAVVLDSEANQLGQAPEIVSTFSGTTADPEEGANIFMSVMGAILTIVGIMIPLTALGDAEIVEMESGELAAAAATGGIAGHLGLPDAAEGEGSGTGEGEGSGTEDPDAILPVPSSTPTVNPTGAQGPVQTGGGNQGTSPGKVPVTQHRGSDNPITDDPSFIGNTGWIAPGAMTGMANSIWQESQAAIDSADKIYLNDEAVTEYMTNQSLVLTQYNDALLKNTDNASVQTLLSVLAGGSFIETLWSQTIYELALSADVISRQINTAWSNPIIGLTYVSFTNLDDNVNRTICNGTHWGARSTQVCDDGGVYYLNVINKAGTTPSLQAPPGFDSLLDYGIMPWWPTSSAALTYRILNPNANVVPPTYNTTNDTVFSDYLAEWATANTMNLLQGIGQSPSEWEGIHVCDQGENAWQLDWSNTGGYTTSSTWYQPLPCCCGYQCSGTAAFFEANNAYEATIVWIAAQCAVNLISVDPVLELSTANIGWNLISGGPPSSIDYGQGHTVTMPKSLPTPCYMGVQGCNGAGIPASSSGEDSGKG